MRQRPPIGWGPPFWTSWVALRWFGYNGIDLMILSTDNTGRVVRLTAGQRIDDVTRTVVVAIVPPQVARVVVRDRQRQILLRDERAVLEEAPGTSES